uniref:Unkown protein n=1 Tax=Riptortus pedestris TaxID=329032 RepID=R4WE10_RIPPE|nr:unkown protein [Riptortus pedestris]
MLFHIEFSNIRVFWIICLISKLTSIMCHCYVTLCMFYANYTFLLSPNFSRSEELFFFPNVSLSCLSFNDCH